MWPLYAHPILRGISARPFAHHIPKTGSRNPHFLYLRSSFALSSPPPPHSIARMASSTTTTSALNVQFSAGSDEKALSKTLETLLESAAATAAAAATAGRDGGGTGGRWTLTAGGEGLERSFKFKTFAKTWDFMTAVSLQCKIKNHHPEWSNVYNTTYIRWTTHNPQGLSVKDVDLAVICDSLARDFGEIVEEGSSHDSCEMRQLADRGVATAGDCCGPKK